MFEKLKNNKNYMFYVKQEIVDRLYSLDAISLNEYKNIAANSYERKLLIEKLDDEAGERTPGEDTGRVGFISSSGSVFGKMFGNTNLRKKSLME